MNHILRDIKLSKLTNITPNIDTEKFLNFWDDLWRDMKVDIDAEKGEIKCWKEGYDYYYFRQYDKNGNLWCDHKKIWLFLSCVLELKYYDKQDLIQYMVAKRLNCVVNTPIMPCASKKYG